MKEGRVKWSLSQGCGIGVGKLIARPMRRAVVDGVADGRLLRHCDGGDTGSEENPGESEGQSATLSPHEGQ